MQWLYSTFGPIVAIVGLVILLGAILFTYGRPYLDPIIRGEGDSITIDDVRIPIAAVARTPSEREQGLSGRTELQQNAGMLFVFPENGHHGIWMKDMLIPIDVVWISESGRVVHIEENLRPESYPHVYEPPAPARYVLETNAYLTDSFGIDVGDRAEIPDHFTEGVE